MANQTIRITGYKVRDIRFPTSLDGTGSDAMNEAGDYSAAYIILETDSELEGHGMTFTIGRGNDVVAYAIQYFGEKIKGKTLNELTADIGATWRSLVADSQLRWIGPEKGVIHIALGAAVNAIWDLWAKAEGKPLWKLVVDFTPEQYVAAIDFRYLTDALTPEEALEILREAEKTKKNRVQDALNNKAVPTYTTSAGWLGYSDEKMRHLLQESIKQGYKHFKLKVGGSVENDKRRLKIAREEIGDDAVLMIDANQIWSVPEAIEYVKQLKDYKPYFIEEPTSPDDILGHLAIRNALKADGIKVATGEMCQNRIIWKQLLASGAIDVAQIDSCRLGGVNEVLAVLLLAKKFNVPIVPHSGGVGLPEYTQHISTIDYVSVSGKLSLLEYVDHLHEHFEHPSVVNHGHIVTPLNPGYSVQIKPSAWEQYGFPNGSWWQSAEAGKIVNRVVLQKP
jgi:L-galactonate dehydratase